MLLLRILARSFPLLPPRDHWPIPEPAKGIHSILCESHLAKFRYWSTLLEEGAELSEEGED